jgi:hypothetical protein
MLTLALFVAALYAGVGVTARPNPSAESIGSDLTILTHNDLYGGDCPFSNLMKSGH